MSYAERVTVDVTTDASGNATVYSPHLTGRVVSIHYVKTDFADGVDFDVTVETTGEIVWTEDDVNASASRYPRAALHLTTGAAALHAAGGTALVEPIRIAADRLKIDVASGGNTKTGQFVIVVE